jgi:outer membrane protein assembly factor BamB
MPASNFVFVGIKGSAVALDRATGTQTWITPLRGGEFVNVMLGDDALYAATKGELYCLDPATGHIRWRNPLKGLGWGLVSIAAPGMQTYQTAIFEKRKREERAAAAAAAASASG